MYFITPKKNLGKAESIAARLLLLHYQFINAGLYILSRWFFRPLHISHVKKIILLRQGGIGDTVVALPAILSIREIFPNAQIDLLTHEYNLNTVSVPALLPDGIITNVFKYKYFLDKELLHQLKKNNYNLFIEMPSNQASFLFEIRSLFYAKSIGSENGIGWQVSSTTFLRKWQEKLFCFDNEQSRLLKILEIYNVINSTDFNNFDEEIAAFITSKDATYLLSTTKKYIALAIGAGEERKVWPLENFGFLARYYSDKGYTILLIGSEKDKSAAIQLCTNDNIINLCGSMEILQTAALLKKCELLISNDTGSLHLAYAAGIPVLGIYSAKDYTNRWYPPKSPYTRVVKNDSVPCKICYNKTCQNNICMQSITSADIIKEADDILDKLRIKQIQRK